MSTSLVAVFIPLLMMGGIVGRLFREFAVTLSIAIGVSLVVSLTTTPTMCAKFLRPAKDRKAQHLLSRQRVVFSTGLLATYTPRSEVGAGAPAGDAGGHHSGRVPEHFPLLQSAEGLLPAAGYGAHQGAVMAAQDISFQSMSDKMQRYVRHCDERSGGRHHGWVCGRRITRLNQGRFFMMLKPLEQRGHVPEAALLAALATMRTADDVINRLRSKLAVVPGATLILQSAQDLTIGGRFGNAQYQYTLQSANLDDLNNWSPRLLDKLRTLPELRDQNSDQQDKGLQAKLVIDRDTASRLGSHAADSG